MNRDAVADLLWEIEALYSGRVKVEDDIARLDAWTKVLENEDAEKVFAKLKEHAKKSPWPPQVSDLVSAEAEAKEGKSMVPSYQETMERLNRTVVAAEPQELQQHLANIREILGINKGSEQHGKL